MAAQCDHNWFDVTTCLDIAKGFRFRLCLWCLRKECAPVGLDREPTSDFASCDMDDSVAEANRLLDEMYCDLGVAG